MTGPAFSTTSVLTSVAFAMLRFLQNCTPALRSTASSDGQHLPPEDATNAAQPFAQCEDFSCAGTSTPCFFFQSPMAALMASSASTEQWIFTGGRESSRTMSVFLIESASSTVLPLTHSVASEELAMADPQPKVLNLASSITLVSGLIFICSFITSPHSGAPTRPVPTLGSSLERLPTLRGLL